MVLVRIAKFEHHEDYAKEVGSHDIGQSQGLGANPEHAVDSASQGFYGMTKAMVSGWNATEVRDNHLDGIQDPRQSGRGATACAQSGGLGRHQILKNLQYFEPRITPNFKR